MAASSNSQEHANFTRLSRLLVDKGTEALRITLDTIHPPANLPAVLNRNKASLQKLKPRVVNDLQWDLLFPSSGYPPDSRTFDVTLLTVLLRNICWSTCPPVTGWNTMPPDTDTSPQANVVRVKLFRNKVCHASSTRVDEATFESLWRTISQALVDLKIPREEIDDLKISALGPEEESYVQKLKEWSLHDENCKNMLEDLSKDMQQLTINVQQHLKQTTNEFNQVERRADEQHLQKDDNREKEILQKLAKHNFGSKIRNEVTSYHPGTRIWLLEYLERWFTTEDESRLFLLTAVPGFGKSVFAAKVCERFGGEDKLAACHFCDFNDSNLRDPMIMLQSLASQICENVSGFKAKLLDQLRRPHKIQGLKDAFQIYLQNPLDELMKEKPILIVIDGLDESATVGKSDMVKLIADHFPKLPEWVKVLITSRPELSLERLSNCAKKLEIEAGNDENESDLEKYFKDHLAEARCSSSQLHDAIPLVVKKCEGSFLYAFHVKSGLFERDGIDAISHKEIMSFIPEKMSSVYHDYFSRLDGVLETVMERPSNLHKLLAMLVAAKKPLPLKFVAHALDLGSDCRETKKIIAKVNEVVSCLLYVSDDLVTVFHKSVYDWLLANEYEDHEFAVNIDGNTQLWCLCQQVFEKIKQSVLQEALKLTDEKLTKEMKHSLKYGHQYLMACKLKESFPWLVDVVIFYVLSTVYPNTTSYMRQVFEAALQSDKAIDFELRKRISWHLIEMCYLEQDKPLMNLIDESKISFPYLESVLHHSPAGCFSKHEKKIAKRLLPKGRWSVQRNSIESKSRKDLLAKFFSSRITALGLSSDRHLVAVALEEGTVCVLTLPDLKEFWEYSTGHADISCCIFSPDDSYILYGNLESVLDIEDQEDVDFFYENDETFNSCAFSPNATRLVTADDSNNLKLWNVEEQCLISVLCAEVPLDSCSFSKTGLFIVGDHDNDEEDSYCVWNAITFQRVDERRLPGSKRENVKSERCKRCLFQERIKLVPVKEQEIERKVQQMNRAVPHIMWPIFGENKTSIGIYNDMDCIFSIKGQSLRVIESIHFTTLAAFECSYFQEVAFVGITPVDDSRWLYADNKELIVFNTTPPKIHPSRPTCVLWCSFSPDGTRLAACTSDGFITLWDISKCRVYQRFQNNIETLVAACCWLNAHLFVFHVNDQIPSLSIYPVDAKSQIVTDGRQLVSLFDVSDEFLLFSKILDFSEGYLSIECGHTTPVKVIHVDSIECPKTVRLPEIKPKMSVAVSRGAAFILGAGLECVLWKRDPTDPTLYDVVLCRRMYDVPYHFQCCFSNDSKFAVVTVVETIHERKLIVIEVSTGEIMALKTFNNAMESFPNPIVFCTNAIVIPVTGNLIEIFDVRSLERVQCSFQRYLANELIIHSKLSPKENVLAVPKLTGDLEFFRIVHSGKFEKGS